MVLLLQKQPAADALSIPPDLPLKLLLSGPTPPWMVLRWSRQLELPLGLAKRLPMPPVAQSPLLSLLVGIAIALLLADLALPALHPHGTESSFILVKVSFVLIMRTAPLLVFAIPLPRPTRLRFVTRVLMLWSCAVKAPVLSARVTYIIIL